MPGEALPGWLTVLENETREQARAELNVLQAQASNDRSAEGQAAATTNTAARERKQRRRRQRRNAAMALVPRGPSFAGFLEPVFGRWHPRGKEPENSSREKCCERRRHRRASNQHADPAAPKGPAAALQQRSGDATAAISGAKKIKLDPSALSPHQEPQTKGVAGTDDAPATAAVRPLPRARPFDIPSADHCETPSLAYAHIGPFLQHIATQLSPGQTPVKACASLKIWDPYFCSGTVIDRLKALGFPQVHNVNEDFYATIADPTGAQLPVRRPHCG